MATIKRRVASVGNKGKWLSHKANCRHVWQVAVTCGKLPLCVAAALAWRGALSSSPSYIPKEQKEQQLSYYLRTVAT